MSATDEPAQRVTEAVGVVHGRLLNFGWVSDGDLEYSQRALLCWRLGAFSRCSNWWVGDWLRYRSSR